jgi:hypothetical protein
MLFCTWDIFNDHDKDPDICYISIISNLSDHPTRSPTATPNLERQNSDHEVPGWELLEVSQALYPVPVPPGEGPVHVTLLCPTQLYTQGVHSNTNTASLAHQPVNA